MAHPSNFTEGTFQSPYKRCVHGVLDFPGRSNCTVCLSLKGVPIMDGQLSGNEIKRLKSVNSLKQLDEPELVVQSVDEAKMNRRQRRQNKFR
jgi:hypothetical protein